MGDKYFWDNKCEKCGKISEATDQPSSLLYSDICDYCGHTSGLNYVERKKNYVGLEKTEECKCKYCIKNQDKPLLAEQGIIKFKNN